MDLWARSMARCIRKAATEEIAGDLVLALVDKVCDLAVASNRRHEAAGFAALDRYGSN